MKEELARIQPVVAEKELTEKEIVAMVVVEVVVVVVEEAPSEEVVEAKGHEEFEFEVEKENLEKKESAGKK